MASRSVNAPELSFESAERLGSILRLSLAAFQSAGALPCFLVPRRLDLVCGLRRQRIEQRFSHSPPFVGGES